MVRASYDQSAPTC